MGGALVGVVVERHAPRATAPAARSPLLNLKLNKNVKPLPVDTRFTSG